MVVNHCICERKIVTAFFVFYFMHKEVFFSILGEDFLVKKVPCSNEIHC